MRVFRLMTRRVGLVTGLYATLEATGRRSGSPRAVPVYPIKQGDSFYLCSISGDVDWTANLRVTPRARLTQRGRSVQFVAVEVDGDERDFVQKRYCRMMGPILARDFNRLPRAADHPTFRIDQLSDDEVG